MNNIVMRQITVTASYAPLSAERLIASVTIACPPGNGGNVLFRGDDGGDVIWTPGEWNSFKSIDLSVVQVKGTPGDLVKIVGGTW